MILFVVVRGNYYTAIGNIYTILGETLSPLHVNGQSSNASIGLYHTDNGNDNDINYSNVIDITLLESIIVNLILVTPINITMV